MKEFRATHPKYGEVTVQRILPQRMPVTLKEAPPPYSSWPAESPMTDELYYRKAIVTDGNGGEKIVMLRGLLLNNKPLVERVIEYEAVQRFKEEMAETGGQRYLHRHYGVVEVMVKYNEDYWHCRIVSSVDAISEAKYNIDFNEISARKRSPKSVVKEFTCHPSELLPFKEFKPKDEHLYAAYADVGAVAETKPLYKVKRKTPTAPPDEYVFKPSAPITQPSAASSPIRRDDVTMKGIDEFLVVLADLPRVPKTKQIGGTDGPLRKVTYRETPRVLARGETTGRLYITPAWWLWRVTGTFKQDLYKADSISEGGKVAERYQWHNPLTKDAPPPPPTWYSYDPESENNPLYDGFLMDLPEIIQQNRTAWYWQLPPRSAREFSISRISIHWMQPPYRVGHTLAILTLIYKEREYHIPVNIASKHELSVKVKSKEIGAYLCRYTANKFAELLKAQ